MKKTKDLKALAKGAVRRLYGKFNPRDPKYAEAKEDIQAWQAGHAGREEASQTWDNPNPQTVNERARSFNKLGAVTSMRRNSDTGEREFLLHRGVSPEEKQQNVRADGTVSIGTGDQFEDGSWDSPSSWTPHHEVAKEFAADYSGKQGDDRGQIIANNPEHIKNHVLSAWIPESKIHGIPNQLGVSKYYKREHEVIVQPHVAKLESYTPKAPADVKTRLSMRRPVQKSLEERIRARFQKAPLAKSDKPVSSNFPPGPLDHEAHKDHRWGKHHPEVYHGLDPNINLAPKNADGVTQDIRFIGSSNEQHPKAVIKAPLGAKDLKLDERLADGPNTSFMLSPSFRTTHREATFQRIASDVFGLGDHVPKTTVFKHPGTQEPWSAMQFIPHTERLTHPSNQLHRYENGDTLHRLALMDSILGHNDRHGGNALIDKADTLHLIDNATAFDYAHRFQTPVPKYVAHIQHSAVPESTHKWLQNLDDKELADKMIRSGSPTKITEMALKRLAEAKRWSRVIAANPDATPELAGAMQVIQSHRFGDQNIMSDARSMAYNRIKRGEAFAAAPISDGDKTQINIAAGWKRQRTR